MLLHEQLPVLARDQLPVGIVGLPDYCSNRTRVLRSEQQRRPVWTLNAPFADYAVWHEVSGHSPKTIVIYRWAIGAFRAWLAAKSRPTIVSEITLADARAFLPAEQHRDALYPDHPTSFRIARAICMRARCGRSFTGSKVRNTWTKPASEAQAAEARAPVSGGALRHRDRALIRPAQPENLPRSPGCTPSSRCSMTHDCAPRTPRAAGNVCPEAAAALFIGIDAERLTGGDRGEVSSAASAWSCRAGSDGAVMT